MAAKRPKTSLLDVLQGEIMGQGEPELWSDLRALFKRLKGLELVEGVIERLHRYAVEAVRHHRKPQSWGSG